MGEGWSDFFAIAMNADPNDDPGDPSNEGRVHTVGAYTTYELGPGFHDNYYFGIRRFPYSPDVSKNPMTYADIDPAQQSYPANVWRSPLITNTSNEVHNVGNLWCNILIEARANMWQAFGFGANSKLMQILVDAMKLDPGTPDFLQARDAIILADYIDFGGIDVPAIWNAFSKRGCGYSATSPGGATSNGIVEAFDLPVVFRFPQGIPTQLPPNTPATFPVEVEGITPYVVDPGSVRLHLSLNYGPYTETLLAETSPYRYDISLPAGVCFDKIDFYLTAETQFGTAWNPALGSVNNYTTQIFLGTTTRFYDDFQTDKGWTVASGGATSGDWSRGVPVNDPDWAYDPSTDVDGNGKCYLTGNVLGNSDVDAGSTFLTSPAIDMSGDAQRLYVTYEYYLYLTDENGVDGLSVYVSNDGPNGNWFPVVHHLTSASTSWRQQTILGTDIAAVLPGGLNSNVRFLFVAIDADPQSVVEAGLDRFHVHRSLCSDPVGFSFCAGDGNPGNCPCGNNGGPGRGCNNSAGTFGARLDASGTTQPDTVILLATQELPSALTLFVQGDTLLSGVHFGDGLRCVGGSLKRLYAKNAIAGQVSAPGIADLPITVQSAALGDPISVGETRFYFTWYRDPNANFCSAPTGSTFNASNAFSIVW